MKYNTPSTNIPRQVKIGSEEKEEERQGFLKTQHLCHVDAEEYLRNMNATVFRIELVKTFFC